MEARTNPIPWSILDLKKFKKISKKGLVKNRKLGGKKLCAKKVGGKQINHMESH